MAFSETQDTRYCVQLTELGLIGKLKQDRERKIP